MAKKIREFFRNISKDTPFVRDYLFKADLKSSLFISIIVSVIEIFMIVMAISLKSTDKVAHDFNWLLIHVGAYTFFLIVALCMFFYSLLYLRGKVKSKKLGHIIKIVFSITSLAFGIYIAYFSYDKIGLTFAFMTVNIYIFCLYIWKPLSNFILSALVFVLFFYFQNMHESISYSMVVNGLTAWLFLFVAGLNVYLQRLESAFKESELQDISAKLREKNTKDDLTGLHNMSHFNHAASIILKSEFTDINNLCFIFIDIENFKNFNEKYGFKAGSDFLVRASAIIHDVFTDSLSARFSDDHFVVLTKKEDAKDKLTQLHMRIKYEETGINIGIKAGIYSPSDKEISPSLACDHARYACTSIKRHYGIRFIEYDESMSEDFKKKQYIINNLDEAIAHDYIKVYYQPVVWAKDKKLCGAEALARWIDPVYGFLSPAVFIPVLEEYHLIHKLDLFVMDIVCKDLKKVKDEKLPVIPVSINFSRLDFTLIDPVEELDRCVKKYNIEKDRIHVEVTESALSESDSKLKYSLEAFRERGYSLWLDDFGSGYSGLNVLKDFDFDMMKIDMKFLYKFSENEKSEPILTSVIELAKKIGMDTLTEGVETEEAYKFLKSIGCQKLQGYLFGKPMPGEDFRKCMTDGTFDTTAIEQNS